MTAEGIVSFLFILSEEGPEMSGEQEFAHFMYDIFDEKKAIQKAKSIKIKGRSLSHSSTRSMKMDEIKEVFESVLQTHSYPNKRNG